MKTITFYFIENLIRLMEGGCTIRESLELLSSGNSRNTCATVAANIICMLGKGESLSDAFNETGVLPGKKFQTYRLQLDRTGDVQETLALTLAAIRRDRSLREAVFRALLYPSFIFAITLTFIAIVIFAGIPWLRSTGFIKNTATIQSMYAGMKVAISSLVIMTLMVTAATLFSARKKSKIAIYWTLLSSLASSGIPFEACQDACDSPETVYDEYTTMTLSSAELTGNYREAFESLARYHTKKLKDLYETLSRLAEPALLCIAGIVIAIIAVTVFLPLFGLSGGFA